MENKLVFKRKQRVKIFVKEYYTAYSPWVSWLRILGGPLTVLLGVYVYQKVNHPELAVFCILYGIYYTLKPLIFILIRPDCFQTIPVSIQVKEDKLIIHDKISKSEILLDELPKILKKKQYYSFVISPKQRLHLPLELLSNEQQQAIDRKLKP